jgi:hypothetical protein
MGPMQIEINLKTPTTINHLDPYLVNAYIPTVNPLSKLKKKNKPVLAFIFANL